MEQTTYQLVQDFFHPQYDLSDWQICFWSVTRPSNHRPVYLFLTGMAGAEKTS